MKPAPTWLLLTLFACLGEARADECGTRIEKFQARLDAIRPAPVLEVPGGSLPPPAKHGRLVTEDGLLLILRGAGDLRVPKSPGLHLYVFADGETSLQILREQVERQPPSVDIRLLVVGLDALTEAQQFFADLKRASGPCSAILQGIAQSRTVRRSERWEVIRRGVVEGARQCGCRQIDFDLLSRTLASMVAPEHQTLRWLPVDRRAIPVGAKTVRDLVEALDRP